MAYATSTAASRNTFNLATILRYRPRMADNITSGPQLLNYAKRRGLVRTENLVGAEECVMIDREDNQLTQWFDGAQRARVAPTLGLVDTYVGHYNCRTPFQISDTERLENAGESKNLNLLEVKMRACERSMRATLSAALAGTRGTVVNRPEGLRDVFGGSTPESAPSTLQRLAPSSASWWAPTVVSMTNLGPNNSMIKRKLHQLFLTGRTVGAMPKLGICDQNFWLAYLDTISGAAATGGYPASPDVRMFAGDRPARSLDTAVASGIRFLGVEFEFDGDVAAPSGDYTGSNVGHCMIVDTDDLEIIVDPRWNFKLIQPRSRSGNDEQWVDVYSLVLRLTVVCYNRRRQLMVVLNV